MTAGVEILANTNILGIYAAGVTEAQLIVWLIWASFGAAVVGLAAGLLVRLRIKQLDAKSAEQDEG